MQDCFRQHPDVYGAELEDDDEMESGAPASPEQQPTAAELDASSTPDEKRSRATEVVSQVKTETPVAAEVEVLVPKAAHDAEDKNQEVKPTEK